MKISWREAGCASFVSIIVKQYQKPTANCTIPVAACSKVGKEILNGAKWHNGITVIDRKPD